MPRAKSWVTTSEEGSGTDVWLSIRSSVEGFEVELRPRNIDSSFFLHLHGGNQGRHLEELGKNPGSEATLKESLMKMKLIERID